MTPTRLKREDLQALKSLARAAHEREIEDQRAVLTPRVTVKGSCVCGAPCATWAGMPAACQALEQLINTWLRR